MEVVDGAHVPDHQPLSIHVGGAHIEAAFLVVGRAHGRAECAVEMCLDELLQGGGPGE